MAVQIISSGPFTKSSGDRPGLYVRFVQAAIAAIGVGSRSKVAMIKTDFSGGTAVADSVYRITNVEQANGLFGTDNTDDIQLIIQGGASEVVVSTITVATDPASTDWAAALGRLETYEYHVYVNPIAADPSLTTAAYTWLQSAKTNGKNFVSVFSDKTTEGNATAIKSAATAVDDETVVFVGGGVKDAAGTVVDADKYACYIAGLIAGTALDASLTYVHVPFSEVITRFKNADVKDLLTAGILVTVQDGDQPRIEQGLTLGDAPFNKIRTVRAKQAMIDDINKAVNDGYIGQVTNDVNGQIAVVNAIKAYLTTLANSEIIASDFVAQLDPTQASVGADLYVNISVRFLDSIEYVYLTIVVQ